MVFAVLGDQHLFSLLFVTAYNVGEVVVFRDVLANHGIGKCIHLHPSLPVHASLTALQSGSLLQTCLAQFHMCNHPARFVVSALVTIITIIVIVVVVVVVVIRGLRGKSLHSTQAIVQKVGNDELAAVAVPGQALGSLERKKKLS